MFRPLQVKKISEKVIEIQRGELIEGYCKRITGRADVQEKEKKEKKRRGRTFFLTSICPEANATVSIFPDEIARQLSRSSFRDCERHRGRSRITILSDAVCVYREVERRGCAESLIRCLWLLWCKPRERVPPFSNAGG